MNPFPGQPQNPADLKFQNLTRDELKKIEKSMKRPQFLGLLNQYMVEISDPKNKQQYDQYLKQMQSQGQLPKNMKLVELTPHFCIRTHIVSEKNKKHNMKFFINYCSTQFLQEPLCQPTENQGKTSFGWRVPNSMGKIRYDQDKNGNPCQVADLAFNPKCYEIINAEASMPFRKNQFKSMIISIGLECAQKQLGQRKQTLSKDYDILKNLKCKGGKPALLPLRYIKGKAYNKGQGPNQNIIERSTEGRQTKLQKQINEQKQKIESEKIKKEQKEDNEMQDELQDKKALVQDLQEGIQQPKYSTIYTYPVDYSQFMQDPVYMKTSKVPTHFTVEFRLPRVQGLEQIGGDSLNVNENRIVLKIGQKYFIDLPFETFKLKYKLITEKIKAKFDKKKKILKVTLEVDRSIKYQQEQQRKPIGQFIEQQKVDENIVSSNQTWKNKVLEVSEPAVDLRVIDNKQDQIEEVKQPEKKLIEQLDEDDQNEQQKVKNENQSLKQSSNFEEVLQQQKNKAFSLRKYYNNKPQEQQQKQKKLSPQTLAYVFQQTNDRIVLVIKMPNYKREEATLVFNQSLKNDFYIEWNTNNPELNDHSKIHILNVRVKQEFEKDIKSVEIVYRVGFVAVFVNKNVINRFWEKSCIEECVFLDEGGSSIYEKFKQSRKNVWSVNEETRNANRMMEEQEEQKKQQIVKDSQIVNKNRQTQPQNRPNDQNDQSKIENSQINQVDEQAIQTTDLTHKQKQKCEYFDYNNLPPQFIHFDLKFIQAMD